MVNDVTFPNSCILTGKELHDTYRMHMVPQKVPLLQHPSTPKHGILYIGIYLQYFILQCQMILLIRGKLQTHWWIKSSEIRQSTGNVKYFYHNKITLEPKASLGDFSYWHVKLSGIRQSKRLKGSIERGLKPVHWSPLVFSSV